jgi:hypothetical protein
VGCPWFPWFGGGHKKAKEAEAAAANVPVQRTVKDYEDDLRKLVTGRIEAAARTEDEQRNKVTRLNPYFFRQYDVYPEGASNLKIVVQEKESRSAPLIADVTVVKQRFATRLHRKRVEAEDDTDFLRDTGADTVTYELRGGKWTRVGSIFIASKTEQKVNGEWSPVPEAVKRTPPSEEQKPKGFLKRIWSRIAG